MRRQSMIVFPPFPSFTLEQAEVWGGFNCFGRYISRMDESLTRAQRRIVRGGALLFMLAYLSIVILIAILVCIFIVNITTRQAVTISGWLQLVFLGSIGGLLLGFFGHFTLERRVKCPNCHLLLIQSPGWQGKWKFSCHKDCPTAFGLSPWSYQLARAVRCRAITCVKCGTQYDLK